MLLCMLCILCVCGWVLVVILLYSYTLILLYSCTLLCHIFTVPYLYSLGATVVSLLYLQASSRRTMCRD